MRIDPRLASVATALGGKQGTARRTVSLHRMRLPFIGSVEIRRVMVAPAGCALLVSLHLPPSVYDFWPFRRSLSREQQHGVGRAVLQCVGEPYPTRVPSGRTLAPEASSHGLPPRSLTVRAGSGVTLLQPRAGQPTCGVVPQGLASRETLPPCTEPGPLFTGHPPAPFSPRG
jgi:hypothetical protein